MAGTALALAGVGALGYGSASVLQAVAARADQGAGSGPDADAGQGSGQGVLRIVGRPAYLAGTALDLLAWLCSLAALRTLPVFQVQGVLAGSLAVTAVLGRVVLGDRLGRAGVLAVGSSGLALVALAASAGPEHPVSLDPAHRAALALAVVPLAVAGALVVRAGKSLAARSLVAAALGGLSFGGAALCARAITVPAHPLGDLAATVGSLAGDPLSWALAAFGVIGMLLYAAALEHGDPARATAMLWLAEVAVPSAVGVGLLGDSVRPGRGAVAVCAVILGLAACRLLARRPDPSPAPALAGASPARDRPPGSGLLR